MKLVDMIECKFCGAKVYPSQSTLCCKKGKIAFSHLPKLPPAILELYNTHDFQILSRAYNNIFAMSALQVSPGGSLEQPHMPGNLRLHGRTYHVVCSADSAPRAWFVSDASYCLPTDSLNKLKLNTNHVLKIGQLLHDCNHLSRSYAQLYQSAKDFHLKLEWTPMNRSISAVVEKATASVPRERQVFVQKLQENQHGSIGILSPLYEPLQYPLLYFHGTGGWQHEMKSDSDNKVKISQIDYYRHLFLSQKEAGSDFNRFQLLGRLLNEWFVDMFSRTEDQRLNWIRHNQPKIVRRSDASDTVNVDGIPEGHRPGRIFLPKSFPGSRLYQLRLLSDALAIVSRRGKPTIFLTFTCNPNWPEVKAQLAPGQIASDRPDVLCAVFHEYLSKLLKELRARFGAKYLIHVIEFQKAGLPHAHICLRAAQHDNLTNVAEIDNLISACLPSEEEDKLLHDLVVRFMIHNCTAKCLVNGVCKKKFPKDLVERTFIDNRGYVQYQRNHSRVVPYNPELLVLFHTHLNVEIAATVNCITYVYKYLYKGPDRSRCSVSAASTDETLEYADARVTPSTEAVWRIFAFDINSREPTVMVLPVHLEGADHIVYNDSYAEADGEDGPLIPDPVSKLELFFHRDDAYATLKYCEYWERVVVTPRASVAAGSFQVKVRGKTIYMHPRARGEMICRLTVVYPSAGELFYVRLLLLHTAPRNFVDMRTVDGHIYQTYQETCRALGVLDHANEHERCFDDAVQERSLDPGQLRALLLVLALDGAPVKAIFDKYECELSADFRDIMSKEAARNAVLEYLFAGIIHGGKNPLDYGRPLPSSRLTELSAERLR